MSWSPISRIYKPYSHFVIANQHIWKISGKLQWNIRQTYNHSLYAKKSVKVLVLDFLIWSQYINMFSIHTTNNSRKIIFVQNLWRNDLSSLDKVVSSKASRVSTKILETAGCDNPKLKSFPTLNWYDPCDKKRRVAARFIIGSTNVDLTPMFILGLIAPNKFCLH